MIRFAEFEALGLRVAAFSERRDGNMRLGSDPGGAVAARKRLCAELGIDAEDLVCMQQVHGAAVRCVTAADRGRGALDPADALPETDGMVTSAPGLALAVLAADCVPLYLFDPVTRSAGMVHAGRRGTFAGIAAAAVRLMQETLGVRPATLHALIGPSAGPGAYEVSPELAAQAAAAGLAVRGRLLDLWASNAQQLMRAGVTAGRIHVSGHCTISGAPFYSHRRDASGSRNIGVLVV